MVPGGRRTDLNRAERALRVPETRRTLCDLLILVEQPTESVVSSDVLDLGSGALGQGSKRSSLAECAV